MKTLFITLLLVVGFSHAQAACTAPWGEYVPEGSMVTAYETSNPPMGQACLSQLRTCNGGFLSGYYTAQRCEENLSCRGPMGQIIPNGGSITAYESNIAYSPQTCQSQMRTCLHGNLTGFFNYLSCQQM